MRNTLSRLTALALIFATIAQPAAAATKHSWSRTRLRQEVARACSFYHLSARETKHLQDAAVDIQFTGAHESSGAWYAGSPSGCYGPWQFGTSWRLPRDLAARAKRLHHKHPHGWRACPSCSTYRFVRVYRDGGMAALRRHWRATLGR